VTPQNVLQKPGARSFNVTAGERTANKIRSLRAFEDGWHYGSGAAPSEETVAECIRIHSTMIAIGLRETDAFPGIDGEILLTAYYGLHYIEVLVEIDGLVTITREINDAVISRKADLNEASCREELVRVAGDIWKPFASYIFDTSIIRGGALQAWHSRTHQKVVRSRSLNRNAYSERALAFAVTSRCTIERPRVTQSFSGRQHRNPFTWQPAREDRFGKRRPMPL
jgi:hypothetical protein